jgi:predicted MFS family arabinose efflux permease
MFENNKFDHKFSTTLLVSIVYPLGPAAMILAPMIVGGVIDNYGFSEQQAGTLASLEGMGLVIASVMASLWIRKVSWTKALFASLVLTTLLNLISANLGEFTPLLIARFLAGISAGTLFAITVAALGDNREPDRAFGIAQAAQGVMMFAAFAAAPYLIETWTVSGLFYMLAAICVLMMLSLFRFPDRGIDHVELQKQVPQDGSTALIWLGLFASVIFFINIFGFWAFIERVGQAAELPANTIGLALGASQVMAIAGATLAAVISDRFGRNLPLLIVLIGQILVLWVLVGRFSSVTFFIGAGVFQALFVIGVAYQMGAIAKIDVKGKFLVLMTAAQGLGAAIGPGIAATLISDNDYSGINLMAALCCLASMLIFIFVIYRSRAIRSRVALA